MTDISWGTKRTCQSCDVRFYDLCKMPATCPKCGATFENLHLTARGKKNRLSNNMSFKDSSILLVDDHLDLSSVDELADVVIDDREIIEEDLESGYAVIGDNLEEVHEE
jgi:hypothetical protein